MTLGDRVAVMRAGVLQQVGTPMELYDEPGEPVRGRLHRLAGDELHAGDGRGRHASSCRWATCRCRTSCASSSASGGRRLIAGIRPEDFEDAALVGDAKRPRRRPSRPRSTCVESMGSELYAHFTRRAPTAIESEELRELAEDAGAGEVPGGGGEGRSWRASTRRARRRQGEEAELWVDTRKLQLLRPEGRPQRRALTERRRASAALAAARSRISSSHSWVRSSR